MKTKLAGYEGRSSANPYPYLIVGDGKNDVSSGLSKLYDDKQNLKTKELNPSFFTKYSLDTFLPADWNFQLVIKHASSWNSTDIGVKSFDLEDRFYGDQFRMNTYSYNLRLEQLKKFEKELKERRGSNEDRAAKMKLADEIAQEIKNLQLVLKPLIIEKREDPIEYCSLSLPEKRTM